MTYRIWHDRRYTRWIELDRSYLTIRFRHVYCGWNRTDTGRRGPFFHWWERWT